MKQRKPKKAPTITPKAYNYISVNIRLQPGDLPDITWNEQEKQLTKYNPEYIIHLRMIHGLIKKTTSELQTDFCVHLCCEHPECNLMSIDMRTQVDQGSATFGIPNASDPKDQSIITIRGNDTPKINMIRLMQCETLKNRRIHSIEETECIIGSILHATYAMKLNEKATQLAKEHDKTRCVTQIQQINGDNYWTGVSDHIWLNYL